MRLGRCCRRSGSLSSRRSVSCRPAAPQVPACGGMGRRAPARRGLRSRAAPAAARRRPTRLPQLAPSRARRRAGRASVARRSRSGAAIRQRSASHLRLQTSSSSPPAGWPTGRAVECRRLSPSPRKPQGRRAGRAAHRRDGATSSRPFQRLARRPLPARRWMKSSSVLRGPRWCFL